MKEFNNWFRFQNYAKDNGYDSLKFLCMFPNGPRNCQWLDAYFGFVKVDGIDGKFLTVTQLDEIAPDAPCFTLEDANDEDEAA